MKNLPFSAILIGISLAATAVQETLAYRYALASIPEGIPLKVSPQVWPGILWDLFPYAIVCATAAFVRLPNLANWFLCMALPCVGYLGIAAHIEVSTSGSCMRGFNLLTGFLDQIVAAVVTVILALLAKAAASLYRRYAHNAQQPSE